MALISPNSLVHSTPKFTPELQHLVIAKMTGSWDKNDCLRWKSQSLRLAFIVMFLIKTFDLRAHSLLQSTLNNIMKAPSARIKIYFWSIYGETLTAQSNEINSNVLIMPMKNCSQNVRNILMKKTIAC